MFTVVNGAKATWEIENFKQYEMKKPNPVKQIRIYTPEEQKKASALHSYLMTITDGKLIEMILKELEKCLKQREKNKHSSTRLFGTEESCVDEMDKLYQSNYGLWKAMKEMRCEKKIDCEALSLMKDLLGMKDVKKRIEQLKNPGKGGTRSFVPLEDKYEGRYGKFKNN